MTGRNCYWISICLISIQYGAAVFQPTRTLQPTQCISFECKMTATRFKNFMMPTVRPCTDMYQYMCGNYDRKNTFEPPQQWKNALVERQQEIDQLALEFLYDTKDNDEPAVKNARTYFNQCLDEELLDRAGDMPILSELSKIGLPIRPPFNVRFKTQPNIGRLMAKMSRYSMTQRFLFDVGVYFDERDEARRCILYFGSTPIIHATPQFDRTFKPPNKQQSKTERRLAYKEYLLNVVRYMNRIANYNHSPNRALEKWADDVVDFLIDVDEVKEIGNKRNAIEDNRYTTIPKLQEMSDEILKNARVKFNWYYYLETLLENIRSNMEEIFDSEETVLVKNIRQFEKMLEILAKVKPKILVGALWWGTIDGVIPMASKILRNFQDEFKRKITKSDPLPREKICLEHTKTIFVTTITHYFIQKDDVIEKKENIEQMIEDIKGSFEEIINNARWMSDKTKMAALHKLDNIRSFVGFADWMLHMSSVNAKDGTISIHDGSFYTTQTYFSRMSRDATLAYLQYNSANPATVLWYYASPLVTNAGYFPQANALAVPLAIMGFPLFGLGLPCLDLGAIGFFIAHELGHAFDDLGTHYNTWGNIGKEWMKKKDIKKLKEHGQCLIDKYDKECYPTLDRCIDGDQTLGENIADNIGFKVALNACRRYVKKMNGYHPKLVKFAEFDHEQLFTLAFAQNWCEKITDDKQTSFIDHAHHSPYPSRLRGVLKNSKDFARIWGCEKTDAMNPPDKCDIWDETGN